MPCRLFTYCLLLLLSFGIIQISSGQDSTGTGRAQESTRLAHQQDSLKLLARHTDSVKKASDSIAAAQIRQEADSIALRHQIDSAADLSFLNSLDKNSIASPQGDRINAQEILRTRERDNFEFLLFIILLSIPALFRLINPSYFRNIFMAYRNPNLSARQLREQLSQNSLGNLVMNAYACLVLGAFGLLLLEKYHLDPGPGSYLRNEWLLLLVLSLTVGTAFIIKAIFLKLLGWIFKIEETLDTYAFNIFLLHKVAVFVLLPVMAMMTFGGARWIQPMSILGIITLLLFLIQRYIRSINSFNSLLNFSKFHFFIYLCASEIMPLLIFVKAISKFVIR